MIGLHQRNGWLKWAIGCSTLHLVGSQPPSSDLVVVLNYWPRALADVYGNRNWAGGSYEAYTQVGGTGGIIFCCHKVAPGTVEVKWMLGDPSSDPLTGKTMFVSAELASIEPKADYLGAYLHPDGTVALDTARGIPDNRLPPTTPAKP